MSVNAQAGYAWPTGTENLGVGLGLRAGYTFAAGLFLAAEVAYFLGGTGYAYVPSAGVSSSTTTKNLYVGGQVGFDLIAGPILFRSAALLGRMGETVNCSGCFGASASTGHAVAGIGLGVYALMSAVFVGIDGRMVYVEDHGFTGVVLGALGFRVR